MPRHTLPKLDLLKYALDGACNYRGLYSGDAMSDEEAEQLDKDIAEIERRIERTQLAEQKKENS